MHSDASAAPGGSLSIAAAQPRCIPYDVAANAVSHAAVIRSAESRVLAFPELSLTGYELDACPVAPDDQRLLPIVDACSATGSLALIGAPTISADGKQISVLAFDDSGARVVYNKMWLSETEAERFVPGSEPVVLEVDGWRLGLAICKDTGITEHAEATAVCGMDVYVAGVLDSADDASIQDERARRIASQHHVWVVVASFAGSTGGGYEVAAAQSRVWSPEGVVVASAGRDVGRIARATLTRRTAPR
jgi:predicted amidohydrolase